MLTSFDRSCFMLRPSCGLTAASFMDKNCEMQGESIMHLVCTLPLLSDKKEKLSVWRGLKMNNYAYLHLPLQGLDIVDDLVQHHRLPSYLNRSKPNPAHENASLFLRSSNFRKSQVKLFFQCQVRTLTLVQLGTRSCRSFILSLIFSLLSCQKRTN